MISKPLLYLLPATLLLFSCRTQKTPWLVTNDASGVLITAGTDSVLFYQRAVRSLDGKYARAHYIHPLYSLHNTVLTEDFPEDHLHHRGIFWAWHQNYVGRQSVGDAWALENFSWEVQEVQVERRPAYCVLHTVADWESPLWRNEQGRQQPFVREKTDITIHAAAGDHRIIDFRIELQALVDSFFIGGSEDEKGYSGFSWRIPLSEGHIFTGEQGKVSPQNLALDAGPWLDISGELDEQPGPEGVTVISHPDNPGHPHAWILRSARSMQNAAYPGRERILIERDRPLVLQYRMVIHEGELSEGLIRKVTAFD